MIQFLKEGNAIAQIDEWAEFKKWVEQTKLYQAILQHSGTGIEIKGFEGVEETINLLLSGKRIESFEQLPIAILHEFFKNYPENPNNKQNLIDNGNKI